MRRVNETTMRTVNGGGKIRCSWCGKKYNDNAVSKAWHWLVYGCWGY